MFPQDLQSVPIIYFVEALLFSIKQCFPRFTNTSNCKRCRRIKRFTISTNNIFCRSITIHELSYVLQDLQTPVIINTVGACQSLQSLAIIYFIEALLYSFLPYLPRFTITSNYKRCRSIYMQFFAMLSKIYNYWK